MLVKCVKYLNLRGIETDKSSVIQKGKHYPVLAIASIGSKYQIHYYIQGSENNDYSPFWANAKEFEVVENQVYSGWVVSINTDGGIKNMDFTPKIWLENEPLFTDALIEEEQAAVDLFESERDKMIEEWGYLDKYLIKRKK